MSYLQAAFEQCIQEHTKPQQWYLVLLEHVSFYGGPEEGGWWGTDTIVVGYKEYPTELSANADRELVLKLANELEQTAQNEYGDYCLRTMEWLDARGLDADYLPEPDGPSKYSVSVTDELPVNTFSDRSYS